jgi:flagellar protein FlaF
MYKMSYAEIMEASPHAARARERQAFDHAIDLMSRAEEKKGTASPEANAAVDYVQRLWTFFIDSLTDPANDLSSDLKKDLISIGLWAIAESDRLLGDSARSFSALIDINKTVRDGLA